VETGASRLFPHNTKQKASAAGASRVKQKSEEVDLLQTWLPVLRIIQMILGVATTIFILLQVRGAGLGSAFGGSSAGSVFKTRRGIENLIFKITIVFAILFAAVSLVVSAAH
jgi:preprotein translocase subunit SecG